MKIGGNCGKTRRIVAKRRARGSAFVRGVPGKVKRIHQHTQRFSVGYVFQGVGHTRIGDRDGRVSRVLAYCEYREGITTGHFSRELVGDCGKDSFRHCQMTKGCQPILMISADSSVSARSDLERSTPRSANSSSSVSVCL